MTKSVQFQMSADARFLMQELRKIGVGKRVTYAALQEAVGKDDIAGPLSTARHALLREENIVFGVIRGEGLKRLSDLEIVDTAADTSRRLRRAARRGIQTLSAVGDFSALPRQDQMRHSASVSIFGVVAEMATAKAVAKIEDKIGDEARALPFAATLEAFRSKPEAAK